jgi:endonuclease/exonuclease/phosphatase (EEP) superfamily protein YafD
VSRDVTLRFQLDHILHDADFVTVRAGVFEAGPSDHFPIWADFRRGPRRIPVADTRVVP